MLFLFGGCKWILTFLITNFVIHLHCLLLLNIHYKHLYISVQWEKEARYICWRLMVRFKTAACGTHCGCVHSVFTRWGCNAGAVNLHAGDRCDSFPADSSSRFTLINPWRLQSVWAWSRTGWNCAGSPQLFMLWIRFSLLVELGINSFHLTGSRIPPLCQHCDSISQHLWRTCCGNTSHYNKTDYMVFRMCLCAVYHHRC